MTFVHNRERKKTNMLTQKNNWVADLNFLQLSKKQQKATTATVKSLHTSQLVTLVYRACELPRVKFYFTTGSKRASHLKRLHCFNSR